MSADALTPGVGPCPTKERGHNGDSLCARSGWPVVRGQMCWRCERVQSDFVPPGPEQP